MDKMSWILRVECNSVIKERALSAKTSLKTGFWSNGMSFDPYRA